MNQVKLKMTEAKAVGAMYCPLCNNCNKDQFEVLYSHKPEWEIMVCNDCSFTFIPDAYRDAADCKDYKDESTLQHVKQGNNWIKLQRQRQRMGFLEKVIKHGKVQAIVEEEGFDKAALPAEARLCSTSLQSFRTGCSGVL